uniref:Coiled-coil domain-containing protein 124-A n=1 Tax=Cacopsylla melanoneura TaxID=428564 RepID=A0A8D8V9I1_9HEMI
MPKKFVGENSKAVVAKARKNAAKEEENAQKQKQAEDEYWKDDNKNLMKKQQKKEAEEKKRLEQLERKKEAAALLEKEMNSIKVKTDTKPPPKITRASIQGGLQKKKEVEENISAPLTHIEQPLEENINRLEVEGDEARTIDEAIKVLSVSTAEPVDMHPEKRMKAAYTAFEAETLPRLKIENPTLRLSQLKQLLRKEWLKSPSNPVNQI